MKFHIVALALGSALVLSSCTNRNSTPPVESAPTDHTAPATPAESAPATAPTTAPADSSAPASGSAPATAPSDNSAPANGSGSAPATTPAH
jgi:PBP1b-binding outer membrane lipoprotein LpoB